MCIYIYICIFIYIYIFIYLYLFIHLIYVLNERDEKRNEQRSKTSHSNISCSVQKWKGANKKRKRIGQVLMLMDYNITGSRL